MTLDLVFPPTDVSITSIGQPLSAGTQYEVSSSSSSSSSFSSSSSPSSLSSLASASLYLLARSMRCCQLHHHCHCHHHIGHHNHCHLHHNLSNQPHYWHHHHHQNLPHFLCANITFTLSPISKIKLSSFYCTCTTL